MAAKDQTDFDRLVQSATKCRAAARLNGDRSDAWMMRFGTALSALGMSPQQLKTAVETFDGQVAADVTTAMRTTGLSLG